MFSQRWVCLFAVARAVLLLPPSAAAQTAGPSPSGSPTDVFVLGLSASRERPFVLDAGLLPSVDVGVRERLAPTGGLGPSRHGFGFAPSLGLAIGGRFELHALLPLRVRSLPGAGAGIAEFQLGRLHLDAKIVLRKPASRGRGLGAGLRLWTDVPLGDAQASERGYGYGALGIVDYRIGHGITFATNLGIALGTGAGRGPLYGDAIAVGVGLVLPIAGGLAVLGELHGVLPLVAAPHAWAQTFLGLGLTRPGWTVRAGVGGDVQELGAGHVRIFTQLTGSWPARARPRRPAAATPAAVADRRTHP